MKKATDRSAGEEDVLARETFRSYRKLWWYSVSLTALVSILPLVLMTGLNHRLYWQTLKAEMAHPISNLTSNARMAIEDFIEKHLSALTFLANDRSCDDLGDAQRLGATFATIKASFHGFVDLGVLDAQGKQARYVGPYDLAGKDYSDQEWFRGVTVHGQYVSDVFLGYRNFPHFIMAVKKQDAGTSQAQVLRGAVNTESLDRYISTLNTRPTCDAFIINRQGVIQTQPRFSGHRFGQLPLEVPPYSARAEVRDCVDLEGRPILLGWAYLRSSPFIFIALERHEDVMRNWLSLRNHSLVLLIGGVILLLGVIAGGCTYFVSRIREADFRHRKALHSIQYTNKMASIGRLAAGVAHEINNPLAIINENAGLLKDLVSLQDGRQRGPDLVRIADAVLRSVSRCKAVTHRLLGFAKRMDPTMEAIVLEPLIREVLGFLGKEAEHRGVTVTVTVEDGLPTIESDRGQLQQVFLNIVTNAFAAVEDGGRIDISLAKDGPSSVAVTIADNGHGISEENLEHIFEPFFTTKQGYGTGLGLSITYGIVQKLGGTIEVESLVGKGTRFTVALPLRATVKGGND